MVQTHYQALNITAETGNAGDSITESSRADHQDHYVIRGGAAGKARLHLLARALRPSTRQLLHRARIKPGMVCLDVGCGGGMSPSNWPGSWDRVAKRSASTWTVPSCA